MELSAKTKIDDLLKKHPFLTKGYKMKKSPLKTMIEVLKGD